MLLAELARDRQWSSSDIKKLAGANLVRVFREVEKVCTQQKRDNINISIYIYQHTLGILQHFMINDFRCLY
jgi:hypothetical protein